MNFYIKIINEVRSRQRLKVDGYSGLRYIFEWDAKVRAYCYYPKDQGEVDDLFRTMSRTTSVVFAPVNIPAGANTPAATPQAETETTAQKVETVVLREPLKDTLVEQCLHRGVIVTDEDTNDAAQRLVDAYDKGARDTLESIPVSRKQHKARKPSKAETAMSSD